MIIRRYINGQIFASMAAVLVTLFVVIAGSRVIKYFYLATQGRLDVDLLFWLLLYQSPAFLEFILPLSFFLGVVLSLGRMYVDNEVTVLAATGFGTRQLLSSTWPMTGLALLISALMTLYVTPRSNYRAEELFAQQAARNTFEILRPGVFEPLENDQVIYVRAVSADRKHLEDVFVSGALANDTARTGHRMRSTEIRAQHGFLQVDSQSGARYLSLEQGERDEIQPGSLQLQRIRFSRYSLLLTQAQPKAVTMVKALTARQLLQRGDLLARGEFYWRISLVILIPVVLVLALSLSRVSPRQGRFLKLLPGVLLYLSYIVALLMVKQAYEKHRVSAYGFMLVHLVYTIISIFLLYQTQLQLYFKKNRNVIQP